MQQQHHHQMRLLQQQQMALLRGPGPQMGPGGPMGVPQPPMGGPPPQGLSRFFSPEVLAQAQGGHAPPPPMPSQKVLTLEEIERQAATVRI